MKRASRYTVNNLAETQQYLDSQKRCIECGQWGHFKCNTEEKSKLIKLTFKVEDNLDEFFTAGDADHHHVINYEVPENEPIKKASGSASVRKTSAGKNSLRKRDIKVNRKQEAHYSRK